MVTQGQSGSSPDPSWERRHPDEPEWWAFDWCSPDGSLGGFAGLVFGPVRAWCWAALVGDRRPYVLVRDLDLDLPRAPGSRGVRGQGLWADVNCETPWEHWSVGLEAFGVSMDDPDEALRGERGDPVSLGLDLEWEASAPVVGQAGAYDQACAVHGEILVGVGRDVETIALAGHGWRRHGWGPLEWLTRAAAWLGGRLSDAAPYRTDGVPADLVVRCRAPLALDGGEHGAVLERALCGFVVPDGRRGVGWAERLMPLGR